MPEFLQKHKILLVATVLLATAAAVFWSLQSNRVEAGEKKTASWLGVHIQEMTPSLREAMKVKGAGLLVTHVVERSPADEAGIGEEDVIVEFNGKKVERSKELTDLVRDTEPGNKVTIAIVRDGERRSVEATLEKRRSRNYGGYWFGDAGPRQEFFAVAGQPRLGIEIHDLDQSLAEYFKAEAKGGALVLKVHKDTPAEKAGLRSGDVIVKIGEEVIRDTDDVHEALRNHESGETVPIEFLRKGKRDNVTIELVYDDGPSYFQFGPGKHGIHWRSDREGAEPLIIPDFHGRYDQPRELIELYQHREPLDQDRTLIKIHDRISHLDDRSI